MRRGAEEDVQEVQCLQGCPAQPGQKAGAAGQGTALSITLHHCLFALAHP